MSAASPLTSASWASLWLALYGFTILTAANLSANCQNNATYNPYCGSTTKAAVNSSNVTQINDQTTLVWDTAGVALPTGVNLPVTALYNSNGSQTGYYYSGDTGLSYLNLLGNAASPWLAWHNFDPGTTYSCPSTCSSTNNAQNYLNYHQVICTASCGATGLTFSLAGSATLNHATDSSAQTQFREPLGEADMSYYLSTAGASSSITITFPKNAQGVQEYAKQFDFYWGSVDTWNSVTFTDILGNTTTFTGSDLCSNTTGSYGCFNIAGTDTPPTMNLNGAVVHFSTVADSAGIIYPWSSVTFTSSAPAFEFDNIRWYLAGCTSGPCTSAATSGSNASPVPEPSSMLLMGTGIFGFATLLKRKMGS